MRAHFAGIMAKETTNGIRKLSSNDSFDEDTLSDDVDDEVFIKSARNGFRSSNKDKTLQKPLMAPRKKSERDRVCFVTLPNYVDSICVYCYRNQDFSLEELMDLTSWRFTHHHPKVPRCCSQSCM